jgi:hypothetical protein
MLSSGLSLLDKEKKRISDEIVTRFSYHFSVLPVHMYRKIRIDIY